MQAFSWAFEDDILLEVKSVPVIECIGTSDAIRRKKNIFFFFEKKKNMFLAKKTWPQKKKKTLKKCFFFKYSFKRNYKLTVA